ncbi:hypothetical protein HNV11_13360 [Spirosoma taeanense]|uniref:DUF4175 domain-containing protein n=1 Tax=Spirosoma taeanense TaxID=2735870 RepID=A0A6M5YAQ4_9BACT|nr:hypothetical protein [Spirosoma taeanense]QJW90293.1 hypothetical protein HNV11_13360 [Spirosoma taeanense]
MNDLRKLLATVTYQLYANALLRCVLLGVAAYVLTATFADTFLWPALMGMAGLIVGAALTRLYENKKPQAVQLIHQTVGDVEYSLPLLEKAHLNLAEQLQLERLSERARNVRVPTAVLWAKAGWYVTPLLIALGVYVSYPYIRQTDSPSPEKRRRLAALLPERKPAAPRFQTASLHIQPPAYTHLPATHSTDLNASALVGSVLTWRLQFSDPRQLSVQLANNRGQELPFRLSGEAFTYQDKLLNAGLYTIKAYWHDQPNHDSLVYQSDFYRLDAKPDLAPKIQPDSKELYRFHYLKNARTLPIGAKISDDFSVARAFIVATVARGSGENVKFREVRIPLSRANFREARLTKTLDLNALQFAPGDELYYYWAAFDNRQPEPNFTKSDTYFVVYKDTTKMEESELATMAVNVMPEYFRSQRQIIIDTEKLIANRKRIADKPFKSASNEIGFDQKALRLRYGQFLGEEFENSIGGGNALPDDEDGNLLAGYMHDHDKGEGEHTPIQRETHAEEHDHHNHGNSGADENKDPLAALMEQYVHQHDDAEVNTFHEQSTRSLLKMALENMWQSELHLRLYEPEKALPFEHKALEYLKLSQQKARSYVRKTGFDPPPIKEKELRLTGELKNVTPAFTQERIYTQPQLQKLVSEVLGYADLPQLSQSQRFRVQQLGNALANRTLSSGLTNWLVLTDLQQLASGKPLSESGKTRLKTKLYALAGTSEQRGPAHSSDRTLERAFWRHMN